MQSGKLFVISAPSGTGKTTLVTTIIEHLPTYNLQRVVTYTSKQPRSGEIPGVDYHFLSEAEFVKKIEEGFFVEYSTVYGAYYGFPKEVLTQMAQGKHLLAIVDKAGAAALKKHIEESILIWIKPPDKESLHKRLLSRAQDHEDAIAFRLAIAQKELDEGQDLFHHIITNDDFNEAIGCLAHIIKTVCMS